MYSEYIEAQGVNDEYTLQAAEHIDTLTLNRITDFEKLTPFQQRVIKRVHKKLETFERENEDILSSQLSSYSLNGVSMAFGGQNVSFVCGIAIPSELYSMLVSTGLCYRAI
jgi:tetraacyldisaccharide-1-P 4'-kinase